MEGRAGTALSARDTSPPDRSRGALPRQYKGLPMRLRKFLSTVLAAVALSTSLLVAGASPAAAYTGGCQTTIGPASGHLYLKLFEGVNYETGTNTVQLCIRATATGSTLVPDLNNVDYPDGSGSTDNICNGQLIQDFGNWNDCASSLQSQFTDCHHTVTVYSGINYTYPYSPALSWSSTTNISDLGRIVGGWQPDANNSISSLKVSYHAVCQSAPVQAF
jgi:hypothetical protein